MDLKYNFLTGWGLPPLRPQPPAQIKMTTTAHNCKELKTMSRRGKKQRRDERSASLTTKSEYEEDKKDPMVMGDITVNDWMMRRCMELEATVKSLQREIR